MSKLERLEKEIEKLKKLIRERPVPVLDCGGLIVHPGVPLTGKIAGSRRI
jgi:hypothetical protein